jgi:hypothetical protein
MKTYGAGDITPQSLTLALDEGDGLVSRPGCFTPGKRTPGTHWIGLLAGCAPEPVWMLWTKENFSPAGNQTPAPRPAAHRYTD